MNDFIELKEQTLCSVFLTPAEALELLALNMEVIPAVNNVGITDNSEQGALEDFPGRSDQEPRRPYSVNSYCRVGHFRLSTGRQRAVRIEPKVGISNVFSLLAAAYSLYSSPGPFRSENVDYAIDKTEVLEPLVRHF